ncbi:hypothetical protein [Dyella flagellata]|nr:hypothetical protein [Dyella flagellata]
MNALTNRVQTYLQALGLPTSDVRQWQGQKKLPYYLQDAFDFGEIEVAGRDIVLALDKRGIVAPAREIRNRLDAVEAVAQRRAVYVASALASYQRQRLIKQRVPFIVPGNQVYLPEIGVVLDERTRARQVVATDPITIAPAAQAMLIRLLLDPMRLKEWQAVQVGIDLGYTPMTVTRAVRELVGAGLLDAHMTGRFQYVALKGLHAEVWRRAKPLLRTPIHRMEWMLSTPQANNRVRLAGLSALAEHTLLAEPRMPIYAMTRADWKQLQPPKNERVPAGSDDAYVIQVWNYSPTLQGEGKTVDPLSLILSLGEHHDERVQAAINELKEQLPW